MRPTTAFVLVAVALAVTVSARVKVNTGFDPATIGHGLINMADRLSAIGGTLAIDTAPGRGTRITATVDPRA